MSWAEAPVRFTPLTLGLWRISKSSLALLAIDSFRGGSEGSELLVTRVKRRSQDNSG